MAKKKPRIKDLIIHSAILYGIILVIYLILCSIQSLVRYGSLGHFYIFGRRTSATEITDKPVYVILYFVVLLLIAFIPNLMMYKQDMREYEKQMKEDKH